MNFRAMVVFILIIGMVVSSLPITGPGEVDAKDGSFGGGSGTVNDPFIIEDVWDLQNMNENLSAHYVLKNDIDASITNTWNEGSGFVPIGEKSVEISVSGSEVIEDPFMGSLDGNGHVINSLKIDRSDEESIGFFGYVGSEGSIENAGMVNCDITGNASVGGPVGWNEGTISNCNYAGKVTGPMLIGGLIGANKEGSVSNCQTNVQINGSITWPVALQVYVGGLIGSNTGTVEDSISRGDVVGKFAEGGLIGISEDGSVMDSHKS